MLLNMLPIHDLRRREKKKSFSRSLIDDVHGQIQSTVSISIAIERQVVHVVTIVMAM